MRRIDIAVQIANGLEAAHEKGIVHRDLKPANVMVADDPSGKARVKLLDFGLAKAYEPDGSPAGTSLDLSTSPTMAGATLTGMIMGTAAYMSPEQARGKPVDRRSDVWAFGCVCYEMLTGFKAFDGETVSDTMASILKEEPDYSRLPEDLPQRLRHVLERCLRKNPDRRLRDIGDVRVAIEDTMESERSLLGATAPAATVVTASPGAPEGHGAPATTAAATPGYTSARSVVPWVIAAVMTLVAAAAYFAGPAATPGEDEPVRRFSVVAPEDHRIPMYTTVAISPTRTEILYPAEVGGQKQLYPCSRRPPRAPIRRFNGSWLARGRSSTGSSGGQTRRRSRTSS